MPDASTPFISTIRTEGAPSGVAVATANASAFRPSAAAASSSQLLKRVSGSSTGSHSARSFGINPTEEEATMPTRRANAVWNGSLTEGNGTMRMASGAYEGPYSFQSRFEEGDGTNPEELIAAAHAGCYSMALSGELGAAGHEVESVETDATVHIDKVGDGFEITRVELRSRARVPGI